jgi:excinuclease ABC subunit A
VTGVSGSGKSTLVEQVLYAGWCREQGQGTEAGAYDRLEGMDAFAEVVLMTQAPVGRSARSNAATDLKAYDEIRRTFAATPAARLAGIAPGHFSFNTPGGRCEECCGMGTVTLEMHFMADLVVACDACGGARFKPHVLAIRHRGHTIGEVLAMTIDEAHDFFVDAPRIRARLAALRAVGLGYLTLGQPTSTLSGGEAQRLKLASFVDEGDGAGASRRLLIFDEPTTGLHLSDVARLIEVLHGIVARGATVLVVEHNVDFIAAADWVVDLGPDGGDRGGEIVATGTPLALAQRGGTPTADALRALLAKPVMDAQRAAAPRARVRSRAQTA